MAFWKSLWLARFFLFYSIILLPAWRCQAKFPDLPGVARLYPNTDKQLFTPTRTDSPIGLAIFAFLPENAYSPSAGNARSHAW
jgi:hypothetical protein